jgi:hypothetical protein
MVFAFVAGNEKETCMKKSAFNRHLLVAGGVLLLRSAVFSAELPEILIQHREAVGSVEAIEAARTMTTQSELSMVILEGTTDMVVAAPDKSWTHVETPVMQFTEASNGIFRWKRDQNRQVTSRNEPARLNRYAPVLPEFQYLFPNDEISVRDTGSKTIDGVEYRCLEVVAPGYKKPRILYLDPETLLCVREETEQEGISLVVTHTDFREVDGITLPFKTVQQAMIPGMPPTTLTITDLRFNEPVNLSLFEPPAETLHDYVFTHSNQVTVPLMIQGEHLMLDVSINDSEPVRFILDSGAGSTIIDCAFADELGLERTGGMHAIGVGGAEEIDRIEVDRLAVGDFSISSLNLYCMDLSLISGMLGMDDQVKGIVGYDLFARAVLKLDYAGRTLTVLHPDHFVYDGSGNMIPGEIVHNLLYIDGIIDGDIEGKLRLDTGAAGGLHLHAGHLKKQGVMDRYEGKREIKMHGAGGEMTLQVVDVDTLAIGDFVVNKPFSTLNTGEKLSILDTLDAMATVGNQVLSRFVVYFDFPNTRLILEPAGTVPAAGSGMTARAGLSVKQDDTGCIVVASVREGFPAEKAGFREGDRIVRFEKLKPGKGLTIDTLNRMPAGPEGSRYRVRVIRNDETLRLRLEW